jgi:hypothetical protein
MKAEIRVLEDLYGDQHLAIGCRHRLKKQIQGDGGSCRNRGIKEEQLLGGKRTLNKNIR